MVTGAARRSVLGWGCIGVGVFMAGSPFAGPLLGSPFDGLPALAWSTDRAVLHVLPGVLAVALGALLLLGDLRITGRGRWALLGALVVLGAWDGLGPWLYDAAVPHAGQSGLMFLTIPQFGGWSELHRVVVKAFCHWLPGMLTVALAAGCLSAGLTTRMLRRLHAGPAPAGGARSPEPAARGAAGGSPPHHGRVSAQTLRS